MRFLTVTRRNFTGSGISDSVASVTFELRGGHQVLGLLGETPSGGAHRRHLEIGQDGDEFFVPESL